MHPGQQTSHPPKSLGRFEVGAKIGGGGMATVYLGREVRADGTEAFVALKVIRDELAHDEQFTSMFVDEAKILARLSHPNVIQTLEYGVTDDTRFIAMELLNGRTVADVFDTMVVAKERFELGTAAWLCARVAEGLHSAHELVDDTGSPLSVIHRDVNPSNIFLTYDGEVKLIDFGLARARVRVSKSAEGIVKGKIPYLAPEQVYGQPFDRRVDIYALGTTLWELVSMMRLFKRDNDIDTLKAIRDARVPDLREDNPEFPEALWKAIDRSLRRDPAERYSTAEEMRTDLDAFARVSGPHIQKVAKLVSRLFPGDEARQAKWMRDATSRVPTERTLAPPAPVAMASSSLLELSAMPISTRLPPVSTPPKRTSDPPKAEPAPTSEDARPTEPEPQPEPDRPTEPDPDAEAKAKASVEAPRPRPKKLRLRRPKKSKPVRPPLPGGRTPRTPPLPPEDKSKLWLIIIAVVAVLLLLAVLATR